MFPLQCCQQPFPTQTISFMLPAPLRPRFDAKVIEYSIPALERVYCPNPRCSIFLGGENSPTTCGVCRTRLCRTCKAVAHEDRPCIRNTWDLDVQFIDLAKQQKWQSCHSCQAMVERTEGCPHIVCKCGGQFCYLCGRAWGASHTVCLSD